MRDISGKSAMKRAGMILAAGMVFAAVALAQESMPKPGPEHKKLDVFVGAWTVEGNVKPNPMGPGGKMSEKETCEWMDGSFFVVCHVDFRSANSGNGSGLSVMGYSTGDKAYTYREFNSWGEFEDSRGAVDGDTWTWTADEKMGDTVMKGRFTMKFTSPASYSFMYETSPDGAKWTALVDGTATKGK
ncbi:MAG: DUF1579 family protein [Candidatus Sulfotelmatobacter sp.]